MVMRKRRERRVPIDEIFARVQVQARENGLPVLRGGANLGVLFLPSRNVRRRSRGGCAETASGVSASRYKLLSPRAANTAATSRRVGKP